MMEEKRDKKAMFKRVRIKKKINWKKTSHQKPIPGVSSSNNKLFIVLKFRFCFSASNYLDDQIIFCLPFTSKTYLPPCPTKRHTGIQRAKRKEYIKSKQKEKKAQNIVFSSYLQNVPSLVYLSCLESSTDQSFQCLNRQKAWNKSVSHTKGRNVRSQFFSIKVQKAQNIK